MRPRLDSQGQELSQRLLHTLRSARSCAMTPTPFNQQPAFRCILIAAVLGGAPHAQRSWPEAPRHPGRQA